MRLPLKQGWQLVKQAAKAWSDDYAPSMGAALSYYTLFSIAPLLLIVISVAGFIFGDEAVRGELTGGLRSRLGAEGAKAVGGLLASVGEPRGGVSATVSGLSCVTPPAALTRKRCSFCCGPLGVGVSWVPAGSSVVMVSV